MTEEIRKSEDEKQEDKKEDEKSEDKEKSSVLDASLNALTETIKGFDINGLKKDIADVATKVDGFDTRVAKLEKALETPSDLPLKPKVSAEDDIGAKVKAPDTYQSNSVQAGVKEADPEHGQADDKSNLSMQEKSLSQSENVFTTETPRPGAALETVEKSTGRQISEVLKAARSEGHEGLSTVGRRILAGDFGQPDDSEVPQW